MFLPVGINTDENLLKQNINNSNLENYEKVKIKFSIKDPGSGISEKDQIKLFSKYDQVESSLIRNYDGKNSGTGLGLYICQNLIESMNGELKVVN